jgi:hypothetical protein
MKSNEDKNLDPLHQLLWKKWRTSILICLVGLLLVRYMQSVATCRRPDLFPAIVHADGTSRVQTVPKDGSGIRELLEKWFVLTGCPMLLNTSLNIRGEPVVNDRQMQIALKNCITLKFVVKDNSLIHLCESSLVYSN